MRCLVTGADGFMGSHLVEALLNWDRCEFVHALVHRSQVRWLPRVSRLPLSVIVGDVARAASVARLPSVDVIFHLAAVASPARCENEPEMARLTNFQGTVNLLNHALTMSPRPVFVFVSSAALYGEPEYLPIDERHPVDPRDQYTYGKLSAEITVMSYHNDQGLPCVIVRPFNVYGPRQSDDFVIPTIITQCLQGVELRLGDGRPVRNFTYVTDAVNMLARAAIYPAVRGKVVNLGSRPTFSIAELAETVVDLTGCGLSPIYDPRKFRASDPTELRMDPRMAEVLLEWRPSVWIEEGLRRTIAFYQGEHEERRRRATEDLYGRY